MKNRKSENRHLYHYTKTLNILRLILKGGFWPQYSVEDFSWVQDGVPRYLAFPCVCFTQLYPQRSADHRGDYGDYAIGFDQGWEATRIMSPIKYVVGANSSLLTAQQRRAFQVTGAMVVEGKIFHFLPGRLDPLQFDGMWETLPYLKENIGFTLQKRARPRPNMTHNWHLKSLEHEDEWRYIPEKYRDSLFSLQDHDAWTMNYLFRESERTHDSHLRFKPSEVAVLIVKTAEEREQLAAEFPEHADKIGIWSDFPRRLTRRSKPDGGKND